MGASRLRVKRFIVRKRHSKQYHLVTAWVVGACQFIVKVVIKCSKNNSFGYRITVTLSPSSIIDN